MKCTLYPCGVVVQGRETGWRYGDGELEKCLLLTSAWAAFTRRTVSRRLWADVALPERADVLQLGRGAGGETAGLARRFPHWRSTATDFLAWQTVTHPLAITGARRHR